MNRHVLAGAPADTGSTRILALACLLAACGKGDAPPPAPAPPSAAPVATPPRATTASLRAIAELHGDATLVAGTRRFAVRAGDRWFEGEAGALVERPAVGTAIAALRARFGELAEVHLGAVPLVVNAADHAEEHVQVTPAPRAIAVEGLVTDVAATTAGHELWRVEHRIHAGLAAVTDGVVTPIAALPHVGPDAPSRSPIGAKLCAVPRVLTLAGDGTQIAALVTECDGAAPIRIATYRWPGPGPAPTQAVTTLPSSEALRLVIDKLVIAPHTPPILIGTRDEQLAIGRATSDGRVDVTVHLARISRVRAAVAGDDGAVWTLTLGTWPDGSDAWRIARDGVIVPTVSPSGQALVPAQLALDATLGAVVLARGEGTWWLLAERGPAGPPRTITAP